MPEKMQTTIQQEAFEEALLQTEVLDEQERHAARERAIARLRLLWEQRGFLFRVTAAGLVLATLLAFLLPKRYESTARLMPPDDKSNGLAMLAALSSQAGGLGALAGDLLGAKNTGALFVGILRSRTVQDRLIAQFDLKSLYGCTKIEDAREALDDRTRISEDRKSGIITVSATDKNPQRASAMAQAYVDELNRLVAEVSTSSARRERTFIEERLKVVKKELDDAAREFSQFASKNTTIDIKEQGRAMVEAAALVQGQVIAAQTELESLKQVYTNQNVRVRAVQARISELQNQLRKLGSAGVSESGVATSPAGDSLYPSIRQLPLLGVTYADLYRRTKIAEVVFELLTQQYELARVQEAKEIATVKLLDRPVPPESKSFPPRLAIVLLGSSLAGLAGIAWVLMCERWTSLDARDPERILGSEVLSGLQEQWRSGARGFGRWIGDRRARWGNGKQPPMGRSSG